MGFRQFNLLSLSSDLDTCSEPADMSSERANISKPTNDLSEPTNLFSTPAGIIRATGPSNSKPADTSPETGYITTEAAEARLPPQVRPAAIPVTE
jgi:hypothetical protein